MKKILLTFFLLINVLFAANNDLVITNNKKNKNLIINPNKDLIITNDALIIKQGKKQGSVKNFLLNNIDPKSLKAVRKQAETLIEQKNIPLHKDKIIVNTTKIYKKGQILKLYGLVGKPMIIEVFDKNKNNVQFKYVVSGSQYLTIEQDKNQPNRLFITPTQKFRRGTIMIGTNIYDAPLQLKIIENTKGDEINTYSKIIMNNAKINKTLSVDNRFKKAIFSEEVNLDNFSQYPKIDYELWSIKSGKRIFLKDAMKIFYVDNAPNKGYYMVLLDKHFKILGYDKLMFKKYSNEYNVYYLDFNINVFSLISESNFKSLNNEERIRVIIKN